MTTKESRSELTISAVDRATATLNKISNRMEAANKPVNNLSRSLQRLSVSAGLSSVNAAAGRLKDSIGTVSTRILKLGAIYAGAVAGVVAFTNSTTSAMNAISNLSSRYAIHANMIQVYGSLIRDSGGSVESAADALGKLRKAQNEAIHGSREHQAAFAALGLSAERLKNMSTEDIMARMADAFKDSNNDMAKQAILLQLMGRNGTVFMDTLNKGSEEYQRRLEEMRADGALLSAEQLADADAYNQAWARLSRTFEGVKNLLGGQLARGLLSTVEATQKWLVANRELIGLKMDEFLKKLPDIIDFTGKALSGLWSAASKIVAVFKALFDTLGPTGTVIAGLAILFAPMINASLQLTFAIGKLSFSLISMTGIIPKASLALKALWGVMAANPIGLIVAAVAGLAIVIYKNWDSIVATISAAWGRIKSVFEVGFFKGLTQVWLEAWQGLLNGIIGGLTRALKAIVPSRLIPDALKNFKLTFATDAANRATGNSTNAAKAASATTTAAAAAAAQAQKQEIQNTIKLEIVSDAKTSVKSMKSGSSGTTLDVSSGLMMAGA